MSDWADERREAARIHEERLQSRKDREYRAAQALIDGFLQRAQAACVRPEELRVRARSGTFGARTGLTGYYLRQDRSVGIDTTGRFYILTASISLLDRLRGYCPEPSPPPLIIGAGGRDGDSIDLADALDRLIAS